MSRGSGGEFKLKIIQTSINFTRSCKWLWDGRIAISTSLSSAKPIIWKREIFIEKILPPEPYVRYPICLNGQRACPPEDCGGIWGYVELLEIIQDPEDEEYDEKMEWLGEGFNPEAFDLNEINQELKSIK